MLRAERRWATWLAACLLPWLLVSCTPLKLRDNAQTYYAATVLAGRVAAPAGWHGPVIVAALAARMH